MRQNEIVKLLRKSLLILAILSAASCSTSVLTTHSARDQREQIQQIPREEWHYARSARSHIRKASQIYHFQPQKAVVLYLTAARELEPYKYKTDWAYRAYDQAFGMAVELIHQHQLWGKTLRYKDLHYTVEIVKDGIDPTSFASLKLASRFDSDTLKPAIMRRGKGVAMVANYGYTDERHQSLPFLPKIGFNFSTTAVSNWESSNKLTIAVYDSRVSNELSGNFTIAHAMTGTATKKFLYQGVFAVLRPETLVDRMGLYCFSPVDPNRTPIVLVHGLAASPNLWIEPHHAILQDPAIRQNYQIYTFFYPTGLPLSHSAAGLKRGLRKLEHHQLG